MSTYSQPLQVLPTWMSYASITLPLPTGGYTVSLTVVQLPLTYYGPSIPLPTDGSWIWGGTSSPAPPTTTTSYSSSTPLSTPRRTPTLSSVNSSGPTSSSTASSLSATATSSTISNSPRPPPQSTSQSQSRSGIVSPTSSHAPQSTSTSHNRIALTAGLASGLSVVLILVVLFLFFWRRRYHDREERPRSSSSWGDTVLGWGGRISRRRVPAGAPATGRGVSGAYVDGDEAIPGDDEWEFVSGPTLSGGTQPEREAVTTSTGGPRESSGDEDQGEASDLLDFSTSSSSPRPLTDPAFWWPFGGIGSTENGRSAVDDPVRSLSPESPQTPLFDVEKETLLAPASTPGAGSSRILSHVERARQAVAARARASYVPGAAAGIFSYFRASWTSSRSKGSKGSKKSSGSETRGRAGGADEVGYSRDEKRSRVPSENGLKKKPSVPSEKNGFSPLPDAENKMEQKSGRERDSPPTPPSFAFPSPPTTFSSVHAFLRHQASLTSLRSPRPLSGYSAASGVPSGNTIYHDANAETPGSTPPLPMLPSPNPVSPITPGSAPPHPSTPSVFMATTTILDHPDQPWLLQVPPQLKPLRAITPLSSIRLPRSTATSLSDKVNVINVGADGGDVLDEPAPLPSVVLQPSRESEGRAVPHQRYPAGRDGTEILLPPSPPSTTDSLPPLPPPGLEAYRLSHSVSYPNLNCNPDACLAEDPPAATGDWQRLAAGTGSSSNSFPVDDEGRWLAMMMVEQNGVRGHYRRSTMGQLVFVEDDPLQTTSHSGRRPSGETSSSSQGGSSRLRSPHSIISPLSFQSSTSSRPSLVPGVHLPRMPSQTTFGRRVSVDVESGHEFGQGHGYGRTWSRLGREGRSSDSFGFSFSQQQQQLSVNPTVRLVDPRSSWGSFSLPQWLGGRQAQTDRNDDQ